MAAPPLLAATPAAKLVILTVPRTGSFSAFGSRVASAVTCTDPDPFACSTAWSPTLALVSRPWVLS